MITEMFDLLKEAENEFEIITSVKFAEESFNVVLFRVYTDFQSETDLDSFESLLDLIAKSIEREMGKYFGN